MKTFIFGIVFLLVATASQAAIRKGTVLYMHGEAALEGYLAYDDAVKGIRPGVLVVHEWWGLNDYIKKRVEMLASLGYIAFAADIYGKDVRAKTAEEAGSFARAYLTDRLLLRARASVALDELRRHRLSDDARIAAIGYCFGGTTVLELARSGADVLGVVSFHGGLDTPNPEDAKNIKGKVLALHGADDPYVTASHAAAFQDEMRKAGVDWQMVYYGGAVHSFSNPASGGPASGNDKSKGVAYDEKADRRSWEAMKAFLAEVFKKGAK